MQGLINAMTVVLAIDDVVTFKTGATTAVPTGTVTTFAGSATGASGYVEGTGTTALFDGPLGVVFICKRSFICQRVL